MRIKRVDAADWLRSGVESAMGAQDLVADVSTSAPPHLEVVRFSAEGAHLRMR
jgi:hypothetical protein